MKQVKTFQFSEADLVVLDALGQRPDAGEANTLQVVISDGLRHCMEHCEPPIHC